MCVSKGIRRHYLFLKCETRTYNLYEIRDDGKQ